MAPFGVSLFKVLEMLDIKDGKIVLMPGADKIPVVKELKKAARGNSQKKFFDDAITYAFYMYKKNGIYSNKFPKKRAIEVGKNYFSDINIWKKFEYNEKFKKFKLYYEELQYTPEERVLLSTEQEIEDLIIHLKDIKYFLDDEVDVEVMIPESLENPDKLIPYAIKRKIKINNSVEKQKSLKAIKEILDIRKIMKEAVKQKKVESKLKDGQSLLAKGELGNE